MSTPLSFIEQQPNHDRSEAEILDMLKGPSEQARPSMRRTSILQKKVMNQLGKLEQDMEGDDSDDDWLKIKDYYIYVNLIWILKFIVKLF